MPTENDRTNLSDDIVLLNGFGKFESRLSIIVHQENFGDRSAHGFAMKWQANGFEWKEFPRLLYLYKNT